MAAGSAAASDHLCKWTTQAAGNSWVLSAANCLQRALFAALSTMMC